MTAVIYLFCIGIFAVIVFQFALILGAPWGRLTQGGQVEGPLPPRGRIIAALSIAILTAIALALLSAEGRWPNWPRWTAWAAVAVLSFSSVLNWITPSPAERKFWGPILTAIVIVAIVIVWSPLP